MSTRPFDGGSFHSVFLTEEGVFVSGDNYHGQIGIQTLNSQNKAQKIVSLEGEEFVSVGCCENSTFFLTKDGKVFACGRNIYGQLGIGDKTNRTKPILVSFPSKQSIQVIVCGGIFVMALTNDGFLFGWGDNQFGQIGVGRVSKLQPMPLEIEALSSHKIISVDCGTIHTLALTKEGKLFSWGAGYYGQLGHGNKTNKHTPTLVSALSSHEITQIACGSQNSVALIKERNRTLCFSWGCGIRGQLGHGDKKTQLKPKLIEALKEETIALIDCGGCHSLAMTKEGTIFTWGANHFGNLGFWDRDERVIPTQMKELDNKDIVHCCCSKYGSGFITREGKLLVCGRNEEGQLGIGDRNYRNDIEEVILPSKILLPLKVYIERAVRKCAIIVLLVLSPFFNSRKRKRERTQVCLYFPQELWLEIFRKAFFDDIPLASEKKKEEATLRAWKMGMK